VAPTSLRPLYEWHRHLRLAHALAKLSRTNEARETLRPALGYFRERKAVGGAPYVKRFAARQSDIFTSTPAT
jgi:hypothetical protein